MLKVIEVLLELFFQEYSDPMKALPRKVKDKIFSYLKGDDLLRCSLVNKDWNQFVSKSSECMDKIRIFICEPYQAMMWKFSVFDANNMLQNGREYKHIALFITRSISIDHLFLLASFMWKSLKLYDHMFKSEIELINFMGLIEPTIEDLDLHTVKIFSSKRKDIVQPNFLFPKLKSLRISKSSTYFFSEIFRNVHTLGRLEIETEVSCVQDPRRTVTAERVRSIQLMLLNNSGIRNLSLFLDQKDFNYMFIDERFLALIRFHLESLKVKKFRLHVVGFETNILQVNNFGKFLLSHKNSMRSLHLLDWMGNSLLEKIINSLDLLKELTLENLQFYGRFDDSIANLNLFKNESIETLSINAKQSKCDELIKAILKTVPNLKNLNIGTVNQKIFETVIEKISNVERITVDIFIPYYIPEGEVLKCLKEIKIKIRYADNIKDMLRDFTDFTNFEAVFLNATEVFDENNSCQYI